MREQQGGAGCRSGWYELTPWLRVPAAYCVGLAIPLGMLVIAAYVLTWTRTPITTAVPFGIGLGVPLATMFLRGFLTVLLAGGRWYLHGVAVVGLIAGEASVVLVTASERGGALGATRALTGLWILVGIVILYGGATFLGAFVGGRALSHLRSHMTQADS